MKTKEIIRKISRRTILLSVIMLVTLSTTANTLDTEVGLVKGNMLVFYLTGVLFFAVYLIYIKISRAQKNTQPVNRTKHYHYRRVIKKTA